MAPPPSRFAATADTCLSGCAWLVQVGTCNALAGLCTCPAGKRVPAWPCRSSGQPFRLPWLAPHIVRFQSSLPTAPAPTAGLCAGWTGFNCLHPMKRYCTHKHREYGFDVERVPANLSVGLPGHAPEVGSSAGRTAPVSGPGAQAWVAWRAEALCCPLLAHPGGPSPAAGECDEDIGACYCPSNTTYGRIPAPPEAPQGGRHHQPADSPLPSTPVLRAAPLRPPRWATGAPCSPCHRQQAGAAGAPHV